MTNNILELHFDSVLPNLKVTNKKQVLQKLAEHTFRLVGTPEKILLENLMKQEKEQSSSIGDGVAVCHRQLPRLTKPFIVFAKLSRLIDFNAADGEPVDMVCLVLSPEHEGSMHLSRLATVARHMSQKTLCDALREANDADAVRMTLKNFNNRRMAA